MSDTDYKILPGRVGNLSDAQTKALTEMKVVFPPAEEGTFDADHPFILDDHLLCRYLRSRDWNVTKAAQRLTATLAWRKENRVDDILTNPPHFLKGQQELYQKFSASTHFGYDFEGRPVFVQKTGEMKGSVLCKYVNVKEVLICHIWDMEEGQRRCREQSKKVGHHVEQIVNILDLTGLNTGHRNLLPYLKAVSKLDEDNYPETLGCSIIINAPAAFAIIWPLVKSFMDPNVAAKVRVLGHTYKEELLKEFYPHDPTQCPSEFGGEGDWKLNLLTTEELEAFCLAQEQKNAFTDLIIGAGTIENVKVEVDATEAPQTVNWYFRTKSNNIKFSVIWIEEGKETIIEKDPTVVDSQWLPEKGHLVLPKGSKGTVELVFDNYASYFNDKNVSFWIHSRETNDDDTYYVQK